MVPPCCTFSSFRSVSLPINEAAADRLQEALARALLLKTLLLPVYVNSQAKPFTKASDLKKALIAQLTGPVRWVETVKALKEDGVEALVEVGPNKVLCGLNRRIDKTLGSANVCNAETLEKALQVLA